ncbi:hypothetical protein QCA50_011531 [Cerrena zonata]|uniref:RanBD1 domain-containing protein n=1 Tax=Cerrena zonata TaxID=2478898 RepID=A0AAW0FVR2_9APHY
MKRGAERQLAKDDAEEEFDNGEDPGRGFVKAEDRVLAGRTIRALPKRATGGSAAPAPSLPTLAAPTLAPPAPPPSTTAPKFAGFAGFGSSGGTSAFTFNTPAPAAAPPAPKPAAATLPTSAFTFGAPSVAPTASNATKTFASFFSAPPPQPTPAVEKPKPDPVSVGEDEELKVETKYLTALRGLNTSLLAAVSKAVESDPFSDVASLLERYKTLRVTVQSEYDDNLKKLKTTPKAPPVPPSSGFTFGGFSAAPPSSSTSTSTGGGFTPTVETKLDATLPGIEEYRNIFSAPTRGEGSSAPGFKFGTSEPPPAPTTSIFTFGSSSAADSTPNPFAPTSTTSTTTPSVFTSNLFGKAKEPEEKTEQEKPDTGIGKSLPSSFNAGITASSTPEKPAGSSVFTFSAPSAFSAPKSGGSIGNPFGFGFGSSKKTEGEASGSSAPSTGFSFTPFAAPAPAPAPAQTEAGSEETESEESPAAELAKQGLSRNSSVHDLPGEGEENEDTIHEARVKMYKMGKNKEGVPDWLDQGVGIVRLKKHKETSARRLLMRNSHSGKIVLNFNLYSGLTPTQAKNVISLVGHDNSDSAETSGAATPMRFRIKTEQDAAALKSALEREVELMKDKSD